MKSADIKNDTQTEIDTGEIEKKVCSYLTRLDFDHYQLGIYFIPEKQMKRLNRDYRGKDRPTDVLSFPIDEPLKSSWDGKEDLILGDVFVCPAQVEKGEMFKTVKHGVVHLLGADHEKDEEEFNNYLEK